MDWFKAALGSKPLRKWLKKKGADAEVMNMFRCIMEAHQPSEVAVPMELVPIMFRQLGVGLLNHVAIQPNPGWIWPFWVERQYDPTKPDFLSRGHMLLHLNLTHRNWTGIGLPELPGEGTVDPRGMVMPFRGGWSVDFWIKENGRLYCPSKLETVRQELERGKPMVRTIFHSDSFEVSTLTFMARIDGEPAVVTRTTVSNISPAERKGAFAAALRPFNSEGLSPVRKIEEKGGALIADGLAGLATTLAPNRFAFGSEDAEDCAKRLDEGGKGPVACKTGMATAAAVYDLSLASGEVRKVDFIMSASREKLPRKTIETACKLDMDRLERETLEAWQARLAKTAQLTLPDKKLQASWEANKAALLMLCDGDAITPGPYTYHHFWFRDAAYQVSALDKVGLWSEARSVLESYPSRQKKDGFFISQNGEWDANGQAIWALANHLHFKPDRAFLEEIYPSVKKGVQWIEKKRLCGSKHKGTPHYGLLPAGFSAEHFGPNDYFYWDDFWCLAGIREAEGMARALGKNPDADEHRKLFDSFHKDIEASLAVAAARLGKPIIPTSPYRPMNSGAIGALSLVYPLDLIDAREERFANTLGWLRENSFFEEAFFQHMVHSGANGYLTMQYCQCLLRRRDPSLWKSVRWLLQHASPTFAWPEGIHPRTLGGVMGDGHHGWAAADWLHLVRNLVLVEEGDRLAILPVVPAEWMLDGARVCVENAPSRFGTVAFKFSVAGRKGTLDLDCRFDAQRPPSILRIGTSRTVSQALVDGVSVKPSEKGEIDASPEAKRIEILFD